MEPLAPCPNDLFQATYASNNTLLSSHLRKCNSIRNWRTQLYSSSLNRLDCKGEPYYWQGLFSPLGVSWGILAIGGLHFWAVFHRVLSSIFSIETSRSSSTLTIFAGSSFPPLLLLAGFCWCFCHCLASPFIMLPNFFCHFSKIYASCVWCMHALRFTPHPTFIPSYLIASSHVALLPAS